MPTPNEDLTQVADALNRLAAAMEQLPARYDAAQQANRRFRIALVLGVLAVLGAATYLALAPAARLLDQILPARLASVDPQAAAAQKRQLMDSLSGDEREKVESLDRALAWVRQYMNTSPDFNAGAAVTYFLADMSSSVEVMPNMYAQVRSMNAEMRSIGDDIRSMNDKMAALPVLATDVQGMNAKMNALPALATEVQGMHAQMSVMAAGMDSTMGRAGRMFPFSW